MIKRESVKVTTTKSDLGEDFVSDKETEQKADSVERIIRVSLSLSVVEIVSSLLLTLSNHDVEKLIAAIKSSSEEFSAAVKSICESEEFSRKFELCNANVFSDLQVENSVDGEELPDILSQFSCQDVRQLPSDMSVLAEDSSSEWELLLSLLGERWVDFIDGTTGIAICDYVHRKDLGALSARSLSRRKKHRRHNSRVFPWHHCHLILPSFISPLGHGGESFCASASNSTKDRGALGREPGVQQIILYAWADEEIPLLECFFFF